jgi:hypothetical protein
MERKITKEEFELQYVEGNLKLLAELKKRGRGAIPCDCGEEFCQGWQMAYSIDWALVAVLYLNAALAMLYRVHPEWWNGSAHKE